MKGLKKKEKTHQQYPSDYQGKGGERREKRVKGEQIVIKGDFICSGEHTIQYTDDVLKNCIPEIDIILLTNVTLINSIKIKK